MSDIVLRIEYPIGDPDNFTIEGNAKKEAHEELISDFLRSCSFGEGEDKTPPNTDIDVYEITLVLDVSNDGWKSSHNCGNLGLRDGILMDIIKRLGD